MALFEIGRDAAPCSLASRPVGQICEISVCGLSNYLLELVIFIFLMRGIFNCEELLDVSIDASFV